MKPFQSRPLKNQQRKRLGSNTHLAHLSWARSSWSCSSCFVASCCSASFSRAVWRILAVELMGLAAANQTWQSDMSFYHRGFGCENHRGFGEVPTERSSKSVFICWLIVSVHMCLQFWECLRHYDMMHHSTECPKKPLLDVKNKRLPLALTPSTKAT